METNSVLPTLKNYDCYSYYFCEIGSHYVVLPNWNSLCRLG